MRGEAKVPYSVWDQRVGAFRAPALYYGEILDFLAKSDVASVEDGVQSPPPCPELKCRAVVMRPYQKKALESWEGAGKRGVIVLPTGAGKTVIGLKAMELVNRPAMVVVPTLDLLQQWRERVEEELGVRAGVYGGGDNTIEAVTISTYDSAYLRAGEIGNRFDFLLFDECLPYDSEVLLADGRTEKIGSLVGRKYDGEVMSYDIRRRRWEPKPVVGWVRKKPSHPVVRVRLAQRFSGVTCTSNHEIYSRDRGWVQAKGLRRGEAVYVRPRSAGRWRVPTALGPKQWDMLRGCLLGGANLSVNPTGVMGRVRMVHGRHQLDYLSYKVEKLRSMLFSTPRQSRTEHAPADGAFSSVSASSVELPSLASQSDAALISRVTPLGLGHWYMDDGSMSGGGDPRYAFLHVEGRDAVTAQGMAEALNSRFGVEASLSQTAKGPLICLSRAGSDIFFRLVAKHIIPSMQHKLPPEFRGEFVDWLPDPMDYGLSRVTGLAPSSLTGSKPSTKDVYSIDVADNGNFIAGNVLVHNCHHLPAESFRQIAEMFTAPYRMGLTATYEREDELHLELPRLVGGVVYRLQPEDLAGRYLSRFDLERVNVELTPEEKAEYDRNWRQFSGYLARNRIWLTSPVSFQRFLMRTARVPEARQALLARNRAIDIAFSSEAKVDRLGEILRENPDERILVYTQHNDLVYRISRRFLLPFVTHTTKKEERSEVLKGFREGRFRAVVTSKVLDEGIDVPEASLGVIVSGTGSSREFVQRLGRLLRKSEGKGRARLIELVSKQTSETRTSARRKRARGRREGAGEGEGDGGAAADDGESGDAAADWRERLSPAGGGG